MANLNNTIKDVDTLLKKFRELEELVKLANKTGIGDATLFKQRYEELNKIAHEINAFSKTSDNAIFNSMANARLGKNIKSYYDNMKNEAKIAGKSIDEYNNELLRQQGIEKQAGETVDTYSQKIRKQADSTEKLLSETKNYVKTWEILNGKRFEFNGYKGTQAELVYYNSQLSKTIQGTKAYIDILSLRRQAEKQLVKEDEQLENQQSQNFNKNIQRKLNGITSFVKNQQILTGKAFEYRGNSGSNAEILFYNDKLKEFTYGTEAYIRVLELRRQVEQRVAKEAQQAAEEQARAQQKAIEDTRNRINTVFSTISSIGKAINNAINSLISGIRKILSIVKTVFNGAIAIVNGFKNTITKLIQLFGNLGNRVKSAFQSLVGGSGNANNSLNILRGTATELRSKILLLKGAFNTLFNNEYIKKAETLYQSIYSLKNIVGDKLTQDTIDWANSMERAFGISARGLISDLNELSGVLYGLGMNEEHVSVGSQNILMMSRYLAFMGAAGGDVSQVMSKLNSGMKGMTQAIDDLGLSVREAQMDSYLKKLKSMGGEYENIGTSFSSLNEEARVYVRYASLIDQFTTKYDMKNFAQALDTTTGRISILKESVKSLGTTIGQFFIEIFGKLAGYITYIVKIIEQQVIKLGSMFNIDLNISADTNKSASAVSDLNDNLEDTKKRIDDIKDASKKASSEILGFDKVTKLGSNKDNADSFDYSKLFNSALDGINELAKNSEPSLDKLKKKLDDKLEEIGKKFSDWAKELTEREDFNIGFNWDNFKADFNSFSYYIKTSLEKIVRMTAYYSMSFADDFNLGSKINKLMTALNKSAELLNTILDSSKNGLLNFYDKAIKPLAESLGETTDKLLGKLIDNLDSLNDWFSENEDRVTKWFDSLADKFNSIIQRIKELKSAFTGNDFIDTNANTEGTWNTILNIVNKVSGIVSTLWNNMMSPILEDLGSWGKNDFLPWLNTELGEIGSWLSTHSSDLKELLTKIGSFAWEGFKKFVDIVEKLVSFAVEHPDAITNMFKGLVGLKIGSWAMSQVGGLGQFMAPFMASKLGVKAGLAGAGVTAGAVTGGATAAAGGATAAAGGILGEISLGPVLAITAGIVTLVAAISNLSKISEGFRNTFKNIGKDISDSWSKFTSIFKSTDEDGNKVISVLGKLKEAWDNVCLAIEPIIELIGILVGGLLSGLLTALGPVVDFIGTTVADALNIVAGLINIIVGIFTGDGYKVTDGLKQIGLSLVDFVISIPGLIGGLIDGVVTALVNIVKNFGIAFLDGFGQGITEKWDSFTNLLSEKWQSIVDSIKNFFGIHSPSTVFADIGKNLVYGLSQGFSDAWTSFKDSIVKKLEELKNIPSNIWNNVTSGIQNMKISLEGKESSRSSSKLLAFAGFRAKGGDIPAGSTIVANENGRLEMIGKIPGGMSVAANNQMITEAIYKAVRLAMHDANSEMTQNGGDVIINNSGLNIYDESTLNYLAKLLKPLIQN